MLPLSKGPGFKPLLESRPCSKGRWANLHFQEVEAGLVFVGFIIPKRLVRRAVDRNLLRRWFNELLREMTRRSDESQGAYLLRVTKKLPSIDFLEKKRAYGELKALVSKNGIRH